MELIQFTEQNLIFFLLIAARISGIFISAPIFSSRNIQGRFKILFTLFLSLLVLPGLLQIYAGNASVAVPNGFLPFLLCITMEVIIGLSIGFVMAIFFAIIQVAGQMLDTQIGFGIVNVMDPQTGIQLPVIGNFIQMLFTIVFFVSDLHHLFLMALINSFEILPLTTAIVTPQSSILVLDLFANMFEMAFKLAMPMIMTTLLVDVSMGMLARTMPQMNVFVVGIPLKLAVGIFMLSVLLPTYIYLIKVAYGGVSENIYKLLTTFAS